MITSDFDSENGGSIPSGGTKKKYQILELIGCDIGFNKRVRKGRR
jgi:hypothetical protein